MYLYQYITIRHVYNIKYFFLYTCPITIVYLYLCYFFKQCMIFGDKLKSKINIDLLFYIFNYF